MIVNCPNCSKKFNIDSKLIPIHGRLLQCSNCNHKWNFVPEKKNETERQTEIKPIAKEAEKTNLNEILINKNEDVKKPTIKKNKKINEKQKISKDQKINKKEKNSSISRLFKNLIVIIITLIAIILVVDTFKISLNNYFPGIILFLDNLYETINDLKLFFLDLIK